MNKKSSTYSTKQKKLVLDVFKANPDKHLTIDDICAFLQKNNTPVGITTIYRQTQKLLSDGHIRKYSLEAKDKACFQYISENGCREHFHLKCTSCGKLFHASCSFLDGINAHIFEHHSFCIDNTRTIFYGLCKTCSQKPEK